MTRDPSPDAVAESGSNEETPEVYAVRRDGRGRRFTRRDFVSLAGAAATAGMTGCANQLVATPTPALSVFDACEDVWAHTDFVDSLAINPDGTLLASGGGKVIKLWLLPNGALKKTLEGHTDSVFSLAISPDGRFLASGGLDKSVCLWSLPDGSGPVKLEGENTVYALAFSPDGKILAVSDDEGVILRSMPKGLFLTAFQGGRNLIVSLAVSPDGKLLAAGSIGDAILFWSLPDGVLLKTLSTQRAVRTLAFTPDGRMLATGSDDKTVTLWSLPDGVPLRILKGHTDGIHALAISPDGKLLLTGSDDKTIKMWSLPEGKLLQTLEGHRNVVRALAVVPNSDMFASGGYDREIKFWSLPDGRFLSCAMDLASNFSIELGITYQWEGQTYTLPCGAPIPVGAVCTCNCVAGSYTCSCVAYSPCTCDTYRGGGHYWYPN